MFKLNHNDESKKFMQKILMFIDSILVNLANEKPDESSKTLTSGLLNIRDAIFAEVMKDSQIVQFNKIIQQESERKKKPKEDLKENLRDSNQETKLANDQDQ